MKYQILRKETDMSGQVRVWTDVGNGEVQILKFPKDPTKTEITPEVDRFLTTKKTDKQSKLETIKQEITELTERKKQL